MQTMHERIEKMQSKLAVLNEKLADIGIRTHSLGMDRCFNEYFLFRFDPSRIFVKLVHPLGSDTPPSILNDNGYWYQYDKLEDVKAFLTVLNK
jgi:hypothetical protein